MNRQDSIRIRSSIRFVAVLSMSAVMFLGSVSTVGEEPIPFNALMQAPGAQAATPPRPQAGQQANAVGEGPITAAGKTEIGVGLFLLAAGVASISITALLSSGGFKPSGAKTPAGYLAGTGATAAGVTLIVLGFHRHKAR